MSTHEILEDKQSLVEILSQFDNGLKVEDVVQIESNNLPESNTLLLQILLEIACRNIESCLRRRQILFIRMWNKITEAQFIGKPIFHIDALSSVRNKAATEFEKELIKENLKIKSESLGNLIHHQILNHKSKEKSSISTEKYELEFEELSKIGKGGFGTVWKVRHKIDGLIYAVKKILFKYKKDSDYLKVIREVKNFATLKHLNVVGYNQAWFEFLLPSDSLKLINHQTDTNSNSENETKDSSIKTDTFCSTTRKRESKFSEISFDDLITFRENDLSGKKGILLCESFQQHQVEDSLQLKITSSSSDFEDKTEVTDKELLKRCNMFALTNTSAVRILLYIQMEYCDFVLREWLDERAKGNSLPFHLNTFEIFNDILNGVLHIHSKGIIHRDLKPQNIFYSAQNNAMKIGDFGLATLNTTSPEQEICLSDYHSSNCGTPPYAAPEQRDKHKYDSKVDMYSLGVILIELLINAQTHMEFSRTLNCITCGCIPKQLADNCPEYVNLIQDLISVDPNKRPSAEEVFSYPIFTTVKARSEPNTYPKINHQQAEVKFLKEALAEKSKRIQELENQLMELSQKCNLPT